jgi:hypothetical protein
MVIFTPDQLSLLQTALSPPMPALHPSPQMGAPAAFAPAPSAPARGSVPLAAVGAGYGLAAAGVAAAGLAAPGRHLDAALLASPALALALGLHALASPAAPLARPLGLLCALGTPWACYAPQPWGLWAAALGLSAFFPATLPPGAARWTVLGGLLAVLLAGGLLGAGGPPRAAWGISLASLALQASACLLRLSRCALRVSVLEPGGREAAAA